MNWSPRLSWLALFRGRIAQRSAEADRADMGTAFGLDASMSLSDREAWAASTVSPEPSRTHCERRVARRSSL